MLPRRLLPLITIALLSACQPSQTFVTDGDRLGEAQPWSTLDFNVKEGQFQFAIVGDRTGGARLGVFQRAMEQVNWLQPEFVISVGDFIEGYSEDKAQVEAEWDHFDSLVAELQMPFFYVVGNHDIGNSTMQDIWRERRGPEYYHFRYQDVLFLMLSTEDPPFPLPKEMQEGITMYKKLMKENPAEAERMVREAMQDGSRGSFELPTNISDDQVAYVEHVLENNADARWTFVLMHKPAWVFKSDNWFRIETLLADRPYSVIAGHQHYYQHEERNGRDYIQMGTTGGSFHKAGPGDMDHITWVTMTNEGPVFANIRLTGLQNKHGENGHQDAK